jgi:hypothetical protein
MTIVNAMRLFVGLDYHQDFVQICILNETGKVVKNWKIDNDWRRIAAAVPAGATVQAALEACCGAAVHRIMHCDARWMKLAQQLKSRGKHVCVVVAAVANRYVRWLHHTMQPEALAA